VVWRSAASEHANFGVVYEFFYLMSKQVIITLVN
jgi:hypothetical protein